jgi:type II secretory pathway predicted ATPase ExeA
MKRVPTPPVVATATDEEPNAAPFPYQDYVLARDAFLAAILKGPFFGLLLGESGMGKTTIPRELSTSLESHRHQILYLSSAKASALGVSSFLAESLRVRPRRSHLETIKAIADFLKAQPTHYTLWIDEADKVDLATLVVVRVIAECDLAVPQLLSVVLSGLPELRATLDTRELFPLKRRITVQRALAGLSRPELDAFLLHRLGAAARRLPIATKNEIFERGKGAPALVAKAARAVLERLQGDQPPDADLLREAIDDAGL